MGTLNLIKYIIKITDWFINYLLWPSTMLERCWGYKSKKPTPVLTETISCLGGQICKAAITLMAFLPTVRCYLAGPSNSLPFPLAKLSNELAVADWVSSSEEYEVSLASLSGTATRNSPSLAKSFLWPTRIHLVHTGLDVLPSLSFPYQ